MTLVQTDLFNVPVYSTRLVRERDFPYQDRVQLRTPEMVAGLMQPYYAEHDHEEFVVLFLNTANQITGITSCSKGGIDASIVEPAKVFRAAILGNAACLICVHNHPSGNLTPSSEDERLTKQLVEAGKLLSILVHDHIIITHDGFYSMADHGKM